MKVAGKVQVGTWTTKEQALRDFAAMIERRKAGDDVLFVKLEDACQAVLDSVKGNDGTWRSYEEHFTKICDYFGADESLHAITPTRIHEFLNARRADRVRGKPPSEMRLKKHLGALGRVFRMAIQRGRFAGANPLDRVEKPKPGKHAHEDVFDVGELGTLFGALRGRATVRAPWDAAVVAALLFTGLRRDALCQITLPMIDEQAGFIRGVKQKRTRGGSSPITTPLAHALHILIAASDDTGHLIPKGEARGPRKEGGRPSTDTVRRTGSINRVFRRCRGDLPESMRSRFHPHAMRHTLRTILADAGVPEHIKNAITDHAPDTVGRGYEHATPSGVRMWATKTLDPLLWIVDPTAERPKAAAR